MKINKTSICALLSVGAVCGSAYPLRAQNATPKLKVYNFLDGSFISNMSDNGKWATAYYYDSNAIKFAGPKIVNLENGTYIEALTESEQATVLGAGLCDITDDGKMAVGNYWDRPAFYNVDAHQWVSLELPEGDGWAVTAGLVYSVTPDGHYGVGLVHSASMFQERGVLWDFKADSIVATPGLIERDLLGIDSKMNRFISISPDGRYVLGCISISYIYPVQIAYYVYDRQEKQTHVIGHKQNEDGSWTSLCQGGEYITDGKLTTDGKMVVGNVNVYEGEGDYYAPYVYDIASDQFTVYTDAESRGIGVLGTDEKGNLIGYGPVKEASVTAKIRSGSYWYNLEDILKSAYGIHFDEVLGCTDSGKLMAASADGKRMVFATYTTGYSLDVTDNLSDLAATINLLASYSVSPEAGSSFSKLATMKITFDRKVQLLGEAADVKITDSEGNVVRNALSLMIGTTGTTVEIGFRPTTFEAGKSYKVQFPAGMVALANDASRANAAIEIAYTGRENKPVSVEEYSPVEGSEVNYINLSANPIVVVFDAKLALGAGKAYLYRDSETVPVCELNTAVIDNMLGLYPTSTQYLYKGSQYKIGIQAGAVTDLTGGCGNDSITLFYSGAYEREITYNDTLLFTEHFADWSTAHLNFMTYDGDGLTPTPAMQSIGFQAGSIAWNFSVSDNDGKYNYCAASTSMYSPAGKANDWMSTPRLYVNNSQTRLRFKAQSYYKSAYDTLRVIVWQHDEYIGALSADLIGQYEQEGDLVFCERLSPGSSEDNLEGDWVTYSIPLSQYTGQYIYIAFVDQNENQSCMFIDDVDVVFNQKYSISLSTETSVVAQSEIAIAGRVNVMGEDLTKIYSRLMVTLRSADGTVTDTIRADGLHLGRGGSYGFVFDTKLPLTVGKKCEYTVTATLDDEDPSIAYAAVKNLAFRPVKRAVIEENTGMTCPNCPLGILALEKLADEYGDLVIPISIHGYGGDAFDFSSYTTTLGLSAAPQGIVNRSWNITAPMTTVLSATGEPTNYAFSVGDGSCWYDEVSSELGTLCDADIQTDAAYFTDNGYLNMNTQVTYAVSGSGLNVNILYAVLEDSLIGYQTNNFYQLDLPILGEWGLGGLYGSAFIHPYTFVDVARALLGMTFSGSGGYIPSTVSANETYKANLYAAAPTNVEEPKNMKIVTMLIDANTGHVLNVCLNRVRMTTSTGIESLRAEAAEAAVMNVYDLTGRMVRRDVPTDKATEGLPAGWYVVGGKKIYVQ